MGGEMPAPVPAPMIGRPFAQIGRSSSSAARMRARTYSLLTPCPPRSAADATQRGLACACVVHTVAHARIGAAGRRRGEIGRASCRERV